MLAVISGQAIISLVITIVIAGLIYWVLDWALTKFALPEPFAKIARVLLVLMAVVFIVNALLSMNGHGFISW